MGNYNKMDMIRDMVELAFEVSINFIPNTKDSILNYNYILGKSNIGGFEMSLFKEDMLKRFESRKIYCITNQLGVNYTITNFLKDKKEYLMILGPCLFEKITDKFYNEIISKNHIGHSTKINLQNYYNTIPIISKNKLKYITGILARFLYNEQIKFKFIELKDEFHNNISPFFSSESLNNIQHIKFLEQVHLLEDRLTIEVSHGNKKEAHEIYNRLYLILKNIYNLKDPLRNAKSYSYEMNTLFRKIIEKAGVQIVLTNSLSIKHINRIDRAISLTEIHDGNINMLSEYCNAVQEVYLEKYSKNISIVMNHINLNFGTDMTLSSLANLAAITTNYLANSFKKEVGISVMDYITKKRIELAKEMLEETTLQAQEIANYVGYNDVSYFSRVFKKQIRMTPTQYRMHMKELQ